MVILKMAQNKRTLSYRAESCPFCNSNAISLFLGKLSIRRCSACGLLFKDVPSSQGTFDKLFEDAWTDSFSHQDQTGAIELDLARNYSQRLISSLSVDNFNGLKILDFGAGRGSIITALAELGADVYGIEPFGYNYLKGKGFKVFRGIQDIPAGLLFDGIVAINVIEHLLRPWEAISELYGHLNRGGWFFLATPNVNSLNSRISASRWREYYNPSHIYFFNSGSIETIFNKVGFVQYTRLRWYIEYKKNLLLKILHYLLQFFKLDGELRYLLRKK
jgi:SAM-dependent methyltransferase